MLLALDYDDTITRDENMWMAFVALARGRGHRVYIVTWRTPEEGAILQRFRHLVDGIFCTSRKAKRSYMYAQGLNVDVWIDDQPDAIVCGIDIPPPKPPSEMNELEAYRLLQEGKILGIADLTFFIEPFSPSIVVSDELEKVRHYCGNNWSLVYQLTKL